MKFLKLSCLIFFLLFTGAIFGQNDSTFLDALRLQGEVRALIQQGRYKEAIPKNLKICKIFKRLFTDSNGFYIAAAHNLAFLYTETEDFSDAEPLFKQVISADKNPGFLTGFYINEARAYNNLANMYVKAGLYHTAAPFYDSAIQLMTQSVSEKDSTYSILLNNQATLYQCLGDYTNAELNYEKSMKINRELDKKDEGGYATTLLNYGILLQAMGNMESAKKLLENGTYISKNEFRENHPDYAGALDDLAGFYLETKDYKLADSLYAKALKIKENSFGDSSLSYNISLSNLATLKLDEKQLPIADSLLNISLKHTKDRNNDYYATSLNELGNVHLEQGKFASADSLFKEALIFTKGIFGESNYKYALILSNLADLNENIDSLKAAEAYGISGAEIGLNNNIRNLGNLSEQEKIKLWETQSLNYQVLPSLINTDSNATSGYITQTCLLQLKLKSFILNNQAGMLKLARDSADPQLHQIISNWEINRATLAKQYSLPILERVDDLDSIDNITNEQEKQINRLSARFRISQQNQNISLAQIRGKLKKKEAAIEFIKFRYYHKGWTDSILYAAFVILPNDTLPHYVSLCEEKKLASLISLTKDGIPDYIETAKGQNGKSNALYNLIWKPLEKFLYGIKAVDIASAGLLDKISFSALPISNNKFLIDRFSIRQYLSTRGVSEEQTPKVNKGEEKAVFFGGISFDSSGTNSGLKTPYKTFDKPSDKIVNNENSDDIGYEYLPYTLSEVKGIGELFDNVNKQAIVITDTSATEESFKNLSGHSPSIIHVATHGYFLPNVNHGPEKYLISNNPFAMSNNPMIRCGIIMAGGNQAWTGDARFQGTDDGVLTAYEISALDLSNTELVVLSACETALGDIRGTEGVFGLQRAFKLAGVKNIILSLWYVPDEGTKRLMQKFYEYKLKGINTHDAFRKAQKYLEKRGFGPADWAAFVLIE